MDAAVNRLSDQVKRFDGRRLKVPGMRSGLFGRRLVPEKMAMKIKDRNDAPSRQRRGLNTTAGESLLRSEIAFWRELLVDCDGSAPPESIERMRQALALAEQRFLQFCRAEQVGGVSSTRPPGTSRAGSKYLH
jgi:hypothetical protein